MWGTCLGFQLMSFLATGPSLKALNIRVRCNSDNQIIPLEFTNDVRSSRLFRNAPEEIMTILREKNVTAHYHNYCVTEE
ncbi:Gamma-glutamyl hydrolase, partial [Gryllus bimaculatus]